MDLLLEVSICVPVKIVFKKMKLQKVQDRTFEQGHNDGRKTHKKPTQAMVKNTCKD